MDSQRVDFIGDDPRVSALAVGELLNLINNERGRGIGPSPGWRPQGSWGWSLGIGGAPGYAAVRRSSSAEKPWSWYADGREGAATTAYFAMREAELALGLSPAPSARVEYTLLNALADDLRRAARAYSVPAPTRVGRLMHEAADAIALLIGGQS